MAVIILIITSSQATGNKIDRSFKVVFWGFELGFVDIKGEIKSFQYDVSIDASTKGLISLLSETRIRSGSVGTVNEKLKFKPIESTTKWNVRGELRKTELKYDNGEVIFFDASPTLKRDYHISTPVGIKNSLDPVSAALWFLVDRKKNEICEGTLSIFDGFRLSELIYTEKIWTEKGLECRGRLKRILGFKKSNLQKQPLDFVQNFHTKPGDNFIVERFEINTVFGKLSFEYLK